MDIIIRIDIAVAYAVLDAVEQHACNSEFCVCSCAEVKRLFCRHTQSMHDDWLNFVGHAAKVDIFLKPKPISYWKFINVYNKISWKKQFSCIYSSHFLIHEIVKNRQHRGKATCMLLDGLRFVFAAKCDATVLYIYVLRIACFAIASENSSNSIWSWRTSTNSALLHIHSAEYDISGHRCMTSLFMYSQLHYIHVLACAIELHSWQIGKFERSIEEKYRRRTLSDWTEKLLPRPQHLNVRWQNVHGTMDITHIVIRRMLAHPIRAWE